MQVILGARPSEDNLRAHLGPSQYGGQGLTLHDGLNGTEAKALLKTMATFTPSTFRGSHTLISKPVVVAGLGEGLSLDALWNPFR